MGSPEDHYGLRSTFFYRKLYELGFMGFGGQIEQVVAVGAAYSWEKRTEWEISDSAWEQVQRAAVEPLRVFAHPLVLVENPRLLAYYRSVAALSQKGAKRLSGVSTLDAYEDGTATKLTQPKAQAACALFNRHLSAIIDSTLTFSRGDIDALLLASAGAQIDGSWRNAIGEEAEVLVRRLILKGFHDAGHVSALHHRSGHVIPIDEVSGEDLIKNLRDYRSFTTTRGTGILFSSEPDVSLRAADGTLIAAVEIKGGKDPNGALERLGAAQKSFTHAQQENPAVHTIYVASIITPEVARRLEEARLRYGQFHQVVNLSALIAVEETRTQFLSELVHLPGMGYEKE